LVAGQGVRLASENALINNYYHVSPSPVPTDKAFSFEMNGVPPPGPSPLPYFATLWQVRFAVRENNIIESNDGSHQGTVYGYSLGVRFLANPHDPEKIFRSVLVRNNHLAVMPSALANRSRAAEFNDTERAIVSENIVDYTHSAPFGVATSGDLYFSGNSNPSGGIVRPTTAPEQTQLRDDMAKNVEDALHLSL
jgi:hypothetical protein